MPRNNLGQVVHTYASVTKQYNLVPAKGRWCSAAGEVTAGLAESNGTCGLTACTPGPAPGPTLGIEYGKPLPFTYMSFPLVPKSVTLNDIEWRNSPYFALFHWMRVRHVVVKQLLGLPRSQNLLFIVYDRINTICAIIQRLFGQKKLTTRFDGRRYIDD